MTPETLSFEAPLPLGAETEGRLSEMLGKVYQYCVANRSEGTLGRPDVTWELDLRARSFTRPEKLDGLAFTPYVDARKEVVGSHFVFRFPQRTETYFVRERVGFTAIQNYLTGNEFERTFTPPLPEPIAADEWDRWGQGVTAEICQRYETVIYPRVIDTLGKIAARRPEHPLEVMDLGGGAGQLSELVCAKAPAVSRVLLVDRSAALVEKARARAARYPGRLTAVCADITDDAVVRGVGGSPDVIILCGVVAQQVMHHAEGVRLVRTCHERLPAGGFALVPSYSAALLSSREYETMGFTVHNKTLSVIEETARGRLLQTNDFYILEKG
jgi:2-polyprenyl-3-methyl-5-hydroxy-6-metoxy-1,4-benzoquinol methylase